MALAVVTGPSREKINTIDYRLMSFPFRIPPVTLGRN
jgi:hypothetical protein